MGSAPAASDFPSSSTQSLCTFARFLPPLHSILQHLIQHLLYRAIPLDDRRFVIGHSGEIHVGEGDSSEWRSTKNVPWRGFAIFAEVKSGSRTRIGVSPTGQNDPGDIAGSIDPGTREHLGKLLANLSLVL